MLVLLQNVFVEPKESQCVCVIKALFISFNLMSHSIVYMYDASKTNNKEDMRTVNHHHRFKQWNCQFNQWSPCSSIKQFVILS